MPAFQKKSETQKRQQKSIQDRAAMKIPWTMSQSMVLAGSEVDPSGSAAENTSKPHRKFKKSDRTRRIWSHREEEILAATLVELVALSWKSDNGFRSGYLQRCEDSIRSEFPTSDIKGTPHIVSKITSWKTSYTSLRNILDRTGVGFNSNGDYKIEIDDDQWEHVVQVDPKAKFMRNKSWPFWETWKCIFGKDRATGAGAGSVSVAAARLRDGVLGESQCDESDSQPEFTAPIPSHVDPQEDDPIGDPSSYCNSDKPASTVKTSGEKRKATDTDVMLMDFLANLHAETNSRLEVISSRIGYDFDLGQTRQAVFDKLGDVDGLTIDQMYQLCNIFGDKPQRLEVFMGMPAQARLGYLLRLMEE